MDVNNYTTMDLANMILQEKTNKITPENIRHDVQIFDIVGNYKGDTGAAYSPQRIAFCGVGLNRGNAQNSAYITNAYYQGRNLDIFDVEHLDVSNVTNIDYSFYYTPYINTLRGLANWNTSNFTSLSNGFIYLGYLTNVNELTNWDISNVTNMANTFYGCHNLRDISGLANWDVSNVTIMCNTFSSCGNLSDLRPLTNWDWNGKNWYNTFAGCPITDVPENKYVSGSTFRNTFSGSSYCNILNNFYFNNCTINGIFGAHYTKASNNNWNFTLRGENIWCGCLFSNSYNLSNNNSDVYNITHTGNIEADYCTFPYAYHRMQDLSYGDNINLRNAISLHYMFGNCDKFVNAGNMNIHIASSDYINLNGMFYYDTNLVDVTCMENWTFTDRSVYNHYIYLPNMFYRCNNLSNESLYAITNFLIKIAPNVVQNSQYSNGLNLSNLCSNAIFTGTNIQINARLNTTQLNRLYMAGYRGFGMY